MWARREVDKNVLQQLVQPEVEGNLIGPTGAKLVEADGASWPVMKPKDAAPGDGPVLRVRSRAEERFYEWDQTPDVQAPEPVWDSLVGKFHWVEEDETNGIKGLRVPQAGALHAVLGYWSMAPKQPATVVMPTGTGKTETMLALFARARSMRLLVIVPSDALRDQLAKKFETYGVLPEFGIVGDGALSPVVGRVNHRFSSAATATEFAAACNVIVTTPSALRSSMTDARTALLSACTHLFIDEAHHVPAETWRQVRDDFAPKPIVQFTATPFREDGKPLGGRQIFAFPLREAQRLNYFSTVDYISVVDFEDQDRTVAVKAIERLRADLQAGRDHLLMARVQRKTRAIQLQKLYEELAPEMQPVVIHSTMPKAQQVSALEAMRARTSKVIVCVDMLGEGFDLPALKVAAIHDPHKSLGVTLQFVGRFARVGDGQLGNATVVVPRPDPDYDDRLRRLYAEDSDWNHVLQDLSETAVDDQQEISDFEAGFTALPDEVALRSLAPKMSTVVYHGALTWDPALVYKVFNEERLLTYPIALNLQEGIAWFVTEERAAIRWGDTTTVEEVAYNLYVLYWSDELKLLFINSSHKGFHEELAKAVCGDHVNRVVGEQAFRAMARIKRLVPTNVGLLDVRNRSRRFSMHVGADVIEGFPSGEAQTKTMTNVFAFGNEDGLRVSVGASLKGRIWSYRVADTLLQWKSWCDHIGTKVSDTSINMDEVMGAFIRPKVLEERPSLVPLAVEWPWKVRARTGDGTLLDHGGKQWALIDADLRISEFSDSGPVKFVVESPHWSIEYQALMGDGKVEYSAVGDEVEVVTRVGRTPFSAYLVKHEPTFLFEDDTVVIPRGIVLHLDRSLPPFDKDALQTIDWQNTNIRKESQGPNRDADSVQAAAVRALMDEATWDLIVDDDGPGEMADLVALRVEDDKLIIKLVHCKYSSEDTPGARVADLYELCGQAQKSARWRSDIKSVFKHLIRREKKRVADGRNGILVGDAGALYNLESQHRALTPDMVIAIVQPGMSKASASDSQLSLLAATEVAIQEIATGRFEVVCSE